ncbi:MAG: pitrilysin family protein [Ignavibacteriaceae bacterium]
MKKIFVYISIFIFLFSSVVISQSPDRSRPPKLPAPKPLQLPQVQHFELSNGLKVILMEKHEVPLVQVNVVIKTGTVNDPEDKTGLANITLDMMDEGAAGKSSLEIADAIDFLGANISTKAGQYYSEVDLHTPLSKFDEALKIMGDIILHPDFPENELERKKKERLTLITQWHDNPFAIAGIAFKKYLYGNHPYGRIYLGNEKSINSFSADDLKKFYNKYFKSNNAFVVAVGDIKKDELKSRLENLLGKWQSGNVKGVSISEPEQVKKRIIYLIYKPGSAQSVIYIGGIGAKRLTPDYNSIIVMNTILGGSFTSRLNDNLREQHGYTYGARSRFSFGPIPGNFIAYASVQTEVTDKSLTEFFKELNRIREPIPQNEVNRAKNLVALSYPSDFQSVSNIANQIENMMEYNLPSDYFDNYITQILNVKENEVNAAAEKYIVPDKMIVVVVGDKTKIEDSIKALNLGEIKNLSIEDVLGKIPAVED